MRIVLSEAIGFLSVPSNVSASLAVISLLLIAIRLPSADSSLRFHWPRWPWPRSHNWECASHPA